MRSHFSDGGQWKLKYKSRSAHAREGQPRRGIGEKWCGAVIENRENIRAKKEEKERRKSVCNRRSNKEEKSCCIVCTLRKKKCVEKKQEICHN